MRKHNQTSNSAIDGDTITDTPSTQTGLLTRCVPAKLKHTALYRWWLRFTRLLQFLSAIISLGIFSSRVYKVYRLVNTLKTQRGISNSMGAVEGILAAAVLYTILATLMMCILRGGGPTWLRWLFVLLDVLFVGGFTAVAVLTRPNGGSAGVRACYNTNSDAGATNTLQGENVSDRDQHCNLPWGTFILAIISTILHAITAAFNEVKDHHRKNKAYRNKHADGYSDQHMEQNTY
ncbi:hypothetical protein EJ08DRAFT_692489 [Tothia fuscella]|uniref:MARVEL domain-containing protein n=1 Tax=Tothia fuscella TaxID=1048955 RepID=A0A9P4P252_9PEZI|nr:hypothetical protein EJ08DRAFT_692489 [Tothia fuscella]